MIQKRNCNPIKTEKLIIHKPEALFLYKRISFAEIGFRPILGVFLVLVFCVATGKQEQLCSLTSQTSLGCFYSDTYWSAVALHSSDFHSSILLAYFTSLQLSCHVYCFQKFHLDSFGEGIWQPLFCEDFKKYLLAEMGPESRSHRKCSEFHSRNACKSVSMRALVGWGRYVRMQDGKCEKM